MLEVTAEIALKQARKLGIDAMEAFLQKKILKKIEIVGGMIKRVREEERSGIAVRSIINKQMSFATTNVSNKIDEIIELSAQNAKSSLQTTSRNFVSKKDITPVKKIRDNRLRDLSLEELSERLHEILTTIKDFSFIQKVDGMVSIETEERLIVNTEGLWKREVGTRMNAQILTTIMKDNFLGIALGGLASRMLQDNWEAFLNSSVETALAQQERKRLSNGKQEEIILSPEAAANIIAFALIPSFYISSGNQQGAPIRQFSFNKNLQIIDDPTVPNAQNTFGFDDEGYPSKPRVVLNGGKCKRLLGMNFLCSGLDSSSVPRGNCYRAGYLSLESRNYLYPPVISSSNFIVKARKSGLEDVISEIDDGLYLNEITGAQDSNYFSGDFVVSIVEGYEVKNGEITHAIQPCFCTGNIYKILDDPSLLIGTNLKEVPIAATPLNVIAPELVTTRIKVTT